MRLLPIFTFCEARAVAVRPALALAGALMLALAGGCRSVESPSDLSALAADAKTRQSPDTVADVANTASEDTDQGSAVHDEPSPSSEVSRQKSPATPTTDAEADALLAMLEDNWSLALEPPPGEQRAAHRWRNAGLEELIAAPAAERVELSKFLDSDDPVVCANAAILLALAGDSVADLHLVEAVREPTLKLSLRCAAAEALGRPDSVLASIALAELIEEYGLASAPQYSPELHAELLRSLSRQIDASDSPLFAAGLRSTAAEVRQAAIESLAADRQRELPRELIVLRADPHPQVRATVLNCLVARRYPEAQEYCLAALGDVHLNVQLAGVAGLGALSGEASTRALLRLANHESETVRAAAIAAIAATGDDAAVFAAAKDPSWHVRRTVARTLARFPTDRATGVARQLLADSNAEVRYGIIEGVGAWPLAQAGPILLTAMSDAPQPTRSQAAAQLTRLWPAAGHFAPDAPVDLRQDQLRQLQTAWGAAATGPVLR